MEIAIGEGVASEVALVRAAGRDPALFADVYRRYADDLYHYLLTKSANAEDAEDLVAETFLAALRSAGGYRGTGSVKAWLVGIARRKAADARRARVPLAELDPATVDPRSTEDQAMLRAELARVATALRALAPDRAEALRLRLFGDLSTIGDVKGGLVVAEGHQVLVLERSGTRVRIQAPQPLPREVLLHVAASLTPVSKP